MHLIYRNINRAFRCPAPQPHAPCLSAANAAPAVHTAQLKLTNRSQFQLAATILCGAKHASPALLHWRPLKSPCVKAKRSWSKLKQLLRSSGSETGTSPATGARSACKSSSFKICCCLNLVALPKFKTQVNLSSVPPQLSLMGRGSDGCSSRRKWTSSAAKLNRSYRR